jgi:CubicO group peptidase (beta-lactamase class C family)
MSTPATPRLLPPPAALDLLDPRLRALCDAYLGKGRVPGASVAVVAADQRYHHAHGVRCVGRPEPVTAATGFNIGSCSKAFVSATLASLVAEGLAKWDDPLSRWVPELQLYDPAVTAQVSLRDVCANRLGLPRIGLTEYGFLPEIPVERIFAGLQHTAPIHPLRDRFTYVNAGHTAAAVAAGRITGQGYLATLRERVLEPLRMTGTSGGVAARSELNEQAGWHVRDADDVKAIEPQFTDNCLGSGGMVVSGLDALQWMRLHLNGGAVDGRQVIAREALLETHRPQSVATPGKDLISLFYPGARMGAYALGWAVSDLEGHPLVCHSGSDHGVTAMTLLLPRAGIGIAVYANAWSGVTVPLAYALAATLLGLPVRDWLAYFKAAGAALAPPPAMAPEPDAAPAQPLSAYAGTYLHPADGALCIEVGATGLKGHLPDAYGMAFELTSLGGDGFAMQFTELPTRLAMVGWQLDFECRGECVVSATMRSPTGLRREFVVRATAQMKAQPFDGRN